MKYVFLVSILATVLSACNKKDSAKMISSIQGTAESVFLTRDQNDNPVVVWTEKENNQLTLFFATSTDNGNSFGERIAIPLTPDVATHPEGMPKVAFKKDGSILAAYEKKAPTKENKYASAIYYVASVDGGKTWTMENFLHRDTVAGKSRSYFDIERLPDGEIGASWLDITLNAETRGRSVLFAKSTPSNRFEKEILIDSSACQCCRIDIYTDDSENIFVAYRGLMKGNMGKQIRDMMIATSTDQGKTFSAPFTISADNWDIDGCPHTGPSLGSNKAGLISLWYTEGSGSGIYYAEKPESNNTFTQRQLVSNNGRHPQLCANGNEIAMLWEENIEDNGQPKTVIHYRKMLDGIQVENRAITQKEANAYLPVVTHTRDGFLTAYLLERNNHIGVYLTTLKPDTYRHLRNSIRTQSMLPFAKLGELADSLARWNARYATGKRSHKKPAFATRRRSGGRRWSRRESNSDSNRLISRMLLIMTTERAPNSDPIIAIGQLWNFCHVASLYKRPKIRLLKQRIFEEQIKNRPACFVA